MTKRRKKNKFLPPAPRIDLHTHSNASDGGDSPSALVEKAAFLGISALALTDHDTMKGLDEAAERGRELGLEFIRGCELGTRGNETGDETHILGLWLPEKNGGLQAELELLRLAREVRNRKILDRLRELGFEASYAELEAVAGEYAAEKPGGEGVLSGASTGTSRGTSIGRPHIAELMVRKGIVSSISQAFIQYLRPGCPAYFPKETLTPEQAVRILHNAGATVVLAHPMLTKLPPGYDFDEWLNDTVAALKPHGLDAVEAYHSEHSLEASAKLEALARRHGLLVSGGSDYHGSFKPDVELGRGRGKLYVPPALLDELKARRAALGQEV